jgi:hypothetical protein
MAKWYKGLRLAKRAASWLFGAPFEELPPAFGDTVPPELRTYEAKVDEMEHHPVGTVSSPTGHGHKRSKPAH